MNNEELKLRVDLRPHDYVCFDCGQKFLTEKQKQTSSVHTCHKSDCCLCGEEKTVTHIRAFNWLKLKENA